jgi:hypothetical protein
MSSDEIENNCKASTRFSLALWLRVVRDPFLAFIRNLFALSLLLSAAWVVASKLDFGRFDVSNIGPTVVFYSLLILFGYGAYANVSIFLEAAFPDLMPSIRRHEDLLREQGVPKTKIPLRLLGHTVRQRAAELLIGFITLMLIEVVFAWAVANSVVPALTFMRTTTESRR